MSDPVYPSLPEVTDDVGSMRAWMKQATLMLQILTGQTGTRGWATQVIITKQTDKTQVLPVGHKDGDLWINLPTRSGQTILRNVWSDGAWVPMNLLW